MQSWKIYNFKSTSAGNLMNITGSERSHLEQHNSTYFQLSLHNFSLLVSNALRLNLNYWLKDLINFVFIVEFHGIKNWHKSLLKKNFIRYERLSEKLVNLIKNCLSGAEGTRALNNRLKSTAERC